MLLTTCAGKKWVASWVAYKGTMFTAIIEALNLVCERKPSNEHDRYAKAVSLTYGHAQLHPLSQGAYWLEIINQ